MDIMAENDVAILGIADDIIANGCRIAVLPVLRVNRPDNRRSADCTENAFVDSAVRRADNKRGLHADTFRKNLIRTI